MAERITAFESEMCCHTGRLPRHLIEAAVQVAIATVAEIPKPLPILFSAWAYRRIS
ncbi:MAG: hypothetical protein AAFR56_10615 [Chloroflexota bacterium]